MVSIIASKYDLETGTILSHMRAPLETVQANCVGYGLWLGEHVDPETQRIGVELETPEVVPRAEAASSVDEEFNKGVNAERTRRIRKGATVNVTGYGDITVQGRPEDRINLLGLKDEAKDHIEAGETGPVMMFRCANNLDHLLTPAQMIELTNKARDAAKQLYVRSWQIKAQAEKPDDVENDGVWA